MFYKQIIIFCIIFITFIGGEESQSNEDIKQLDENTDKRYSNSMSYYGFNQVQNALDFSGKVALVTGSNSGIGAETVRLLSYLGAQVVVTGRNTTRIRQVANECCLLSPNRFKPLEVRADLTDMDELESLVYKTVRTYGKIDILVNNAGILIIGNITDRNFTSGFNANTAINEVAAVQLTRLAVPYLNQTNGTIIFNAGAAGVASYVNELSYGMSKAAILLMTKTLCAELGPNIRVNAVSPGLINGTRMYRYEPGHEDELLRVYLPSVSLGRVGTPLDAAKAILFMASPLSSWIDGFNLGVTGSSFG